VAVVGLLSGGLLIPGAALAAPSLPGTLVGTVACGAQDAPLAHVSVAVEGVNVTTRSADGGKFVLVVPAAQAFTVDAIDPSSSAVASLYNVSVKAGETLDVGTIELSGCPKPAMVDAVAAPAAQDMPQEDMRDISVDGDQ
jgi:hypothetical protein